MQLTTDRNPQVVAFESETLGPPIPASVILITFKETARIIYTSASTLKFTAGLLLQNFSLHDENGTQVFIAPLVPALVAATLIGPAFCSAIAGPEQGRVNFFVNNLLDGTWPKDCYAKPGYTLRAGNLFTLGGTLVTYKVQYAVHNE